MLTKSILTLVCPCFTPLRPCCTFFVGFVLCFVFYRCAPVLSLLGGAVAKLLVRWTPDRAIRVRASAQALRWVLGQDTLLS